MRLCDLQWSAWFVVLICVEVRCVATGTLSAVDKIALDRGGPLRVEGTVKAIHAQLDTPNPVWIQLWQPASSDGRQFTLFWQKELVPHFGNGSYEVIDLEVREYIRINKSHRLGIMNIAFPGPVDGVFQQGGRVVMSLEKTNNKIIHRGQLLRFDGLQYPYNLPVVLCNETGCPQLSAAYRSKSASTTTTATLIVEDARDENLLTRGMIIGLIAWNALVSLFLIIVIITLIVVCIETDDDREKRDRYERAQQVHVLCSGSGFEPVAEGGEAAPPSSLGVDHPAMRELRDDVSDYYDIGNIESGKESVRF